MKIRDETVVPRDDYWGASYPSKRHSTRHNTEDEKLIIFANLRDMLCTRTADLAIPNSVLQPELRLANAAGQ